MKKKKPEELPLELDNLDFSILSYLRENSKTPIKKMAKELNIHPNTLIQRIKKMETSGVIRKYSAAVDYSKTGYDLHVVIMVKVRTRGKVGFGELKQLKSIKELETIYATTGLWDALLICRVKNRQHLLDVIKMIGDHPVVLKTSSSIILQCYKDSAEFNPFQHD